MLLCFTLVLSLIACGQSEQDKKYDDLVDQASASGASDLESTPAPDPEALSANLVLRTYAFTYIERGPAPEEGAEYHKEPAAAM